jgi:hypothetical protein
MAMTHRHEMLYKYTQNVPYVLIILNFMLRLKTRQTVTSIFADTKKIKLKFTTYLRRKLCKNHTPIAVIKLTEILKGSFVCIFVAIDTECRHAYAMGKIHFTCKAYLLR